MKKIIPVCALAGLMALAGCSSTDVKNDEEKVTEDTEQAVSSLDADTKKALNDFRDAADDMTQDVIDFADTTENDTEEAVNDFKKEYETLFDGASSKFDAVYDKLAEHAELQQAMTDLKDKAQELYGKLTAEGYSAEQAAEIDTQDFMNAMQSFDQQYFSVNNLR